MFDSYMNDVLSHSIQPTDPASERVGHAHIISFSTQEGFHRDELLNPSWYGTISNDDKHGLPEIARKYDFQMEERLLADTLTEVEPGATHWLLGQTYNDLPKATLDMVKRQNDFSKKELQIELYRHLLSN